MIGPMTKLQVVYVVVGLIVVISMVLPAILTGR
jgi:hypothetical protein